MNLLKKLIRKLYLRFRSAPLSEEQRSQILIDRIRKCGGHVGENVDILSSSIDMGEPYLLSIGDNVTLTTMRLLTHDASTKKFLGYTKVGRVTIGNNVFVGAGSIILPGTTIGNNVIIGAGSIVASDIPDNTVACGSPCKAICTCDEYISRMKTKMGEVPCFDLFPHDLMDEIHTSERQFIATAGYGFVK